MHRDEMRAGMVVKPAELGAHVLTHNIYASQSMYAHMICGRRYLISRIEPVSAASPVIACQKCYEAHMANEIATTGHPPRIMPNKQPSTGKQIRAVFKCANQRCKEYDKEFASRNKYDAQCPNCRRPAIWQRGYDA